MEWLNKILLSIHVVCGFSSLMVFLIPVFNRKGGRWHILIGKLYVALMWIVVSTAFILSIINLIEGQYFTAAFLGFLSILTSHPLWYGLAVLKYRDKLPDSFLFKRRMLESAIFIFAIINICVFIYLKGKGQAILLLIFGILGLFAGSNIFKSSEKLRANTNRLGDHISSMVTSGIAAYTAFFAFGGYTLFANIYEGYTVALFWTLPGILGALIISYFKRKHKAQALA